MTEIVLIALIVVILVLLYIDFDPKFDTIVVGGKERRIMWYNGRDGRNWTFL